MICVFSMPVQAGDSGSYFKELRNGEGLIVQRDADTFLIFLFTYGHETCVDSEPTVSPTLFEEECSTNGQRWFFGSGPLREISETVSGTLFITRGVDYPEGFDGRVGEPIEVGLFLVTRSGAGYTMSVERFGPELEPDDFLFAELFRTPTVLIKATE